jgi:hypothetical protein
MDKAEKQLTDLKIALHRIRHVLNLSQRIDDPEAKLAQVKHIVESVLSSWQPA